ASGAQSIMIHTVAAQNKIIMQNAIMRRKKDQMLVADDIASTRDSWIFGLVAPALLYSAQRRRRSANN
ncbi:MAG: hypothetical protein ABIO19_08885, partial [Burkholderiaceae bacterium]